MQALVSLSCYRYTLAPVFRALIQANEAALVSMPKLNRLSAFQQEVAETVRKWMNSLCGMKFPHEASVHANGQHITTLSFSALTLSGDCSHMGRWLL